MTPWVTGCLTEVGTNVASSLHWGQDAIHCEFHNTVRPRLTAHIRLPQKYPDTEVREPNNRTHMLYVRIHKCKSVTNDYLPDGEGCG